MTGLSDSLIVNKTDLTQSDTIVILNQSAGYLQLDLLDAFGSKYANRVIIAGEIRFREKPLDAAIKWHKVIKYNRKTKLTRMATWLICTIQMLRILITKYRQADLLIVSNPPTSILLPLILKNSFSLLIYDVYPDSLYQSGLIIRESWIIKFWGKINRKVFRRANRIFSLTDGMKEALSAYVNLDKIEVTPIWTDNKFLKPLPKDKNSFIRKHNLSEKFIVMYSGNIGYTHPVEIIIDIAKRVVNPNIQFLIIGEGEKKKMLVEKANKFSLDNITFLPYQPTNELPNSLAAADIALVTLADGSSTLSVPSKTYNLFSVGAAILGISNQSSELSKVLHKNKCGKCFSTNEINAIKDFIEKLAMNQKLLNTYRDNSLKASLQYGIENAKRFL